MTNQDIVRSVVTSGFCKITCAVLGDQDEGYSIYILFIIDIQYYLIYLRQLGECVSVYCVTAGGVTGVESAVLAGTKLYSVSLVGYANLFK